MKRRVVVTGGAGFVGSHLCEALMAEGCEVICVDNLSTGDLGNLAHLLDHRSFCFQQADVCSGLHVAGPVHAVLHFASPASPVDYLRLPVETLAVGAHGTLHALELARDKGARFLLASTSETYGDPLVHPQHESYWGNVNPVGPRSVYDEAKRYAEALTTAYRRTHAVDTAIVRIFNTYGPRMRPYDGRAIPTFLRQALAGEPLTVHGDGSQTRSVCYVDDLVDGILRMLHSELAGPCNLGNPRELSVLELARTVLAVTGSYSHIEFVERPQDDPELRRPDITLAQTQLSWHPTVDLVDGLRRTAEDFACLLLPAPASPGPAGPAVATARRRATTPAVSSCGLVTGA
jgi:nucleoside-diphosphate-sugar epimerase